MRKNDDRIVLIVIIVVILALGSLIMLLPQGKKIGPYSSYGVESDGIKGAYLLLAQFQFTLSRLEGEIEQLKEGDVLFLIEPEPEYGMKQEMLKRINRWVYNGNTVVLAGDYRKYFLYSLSADPDQEALIHLAVFRWTEKHEKVYVDVPYGKGNFRLIPNVRLFTNGLLKKEGTATKLMEALWVYRDKPVVFYEYSPELTGSPQQRRKSPLSLLNTSWKLILLQSFIGLLLLFIFNGRRLGKAIDYEKETLREENEDTKALASLMEQAALKEDALHLYYEQFRDEACRFFKVSGLKENDEESFKRLEDLWEKRSLRHGEKLKEIHRSLSLVNRTLSHQEVAAAFQKIDILREEMRIK